MPNLLHNEMLEFIPTVIPDNDQKHQVRLLPHANAPRSVVLIPYKIPD